MLHLFAALLLRLTGPLAAAAVGDMVLRLPGAESLRDATDIGLGGCTATAGSAATGDVSCSGTHGAASWAGIAVCCDASSAAVATLGAGASAVGCCGGGGDAGGAAAGVWTNCTATGPGEGGDNAAGGERGCCCAWVCALRSACATI